jgi:hypothetical protein
MQFFWLPGGLKPPAFTLRRCRLSMTMPMDGTVLAHYVI